MAQGLYEVEAGYAVSDVTTGDVVHQLIPVGGIPGDAGLTAAEIALTDNAPIGSNALDTLTGLYYRKKTLGAGTASWVRIVDQDDNTALQNGLQAQIDALINGQDFREHALVKDSSLYTNLAAAELAVNIGTIDSTAVASSDRILFDNITGSNKNVYIVTGTIGAGATLVEDNNLANVGDTVYIASGTNAGRRFTYNNTGAWVLSFSEESYNISTTVSGAGQTIDTVKIKDFDIVKWFVSTKDVALNKRDYRELTYMNNASTTADATTTDDDNSVSNKMRSGGKIAGLKYRVVLSGTGANQVANLVSDSTGSISIKVRRELFKV